MIFLKYNLYLECWFEEGGCIESSEMESGSWRDCCQSWVNSATPVYRDKLGSKLELIEGVLRETEPQALFNHHTYSGFNNRLQPAKFRDLYLNKKNTQNVTF